MVGRHRLRVAIFLPAMRFPTGAQGGDRHPARHHRRGKTSVRPGKIGGRPRRRGADLADDGRISRIWRRPLRRLLRYQARAHPWAVHLRRRRKTDSRRCKRRLARRNFRSWPPACASSCRTKKAGGWGSRLRRPACRRFLILSGAIHEVSFPHREDLCSGRRRRKRSAGANHAPRGLRPSGRSGNHGRRTDPELLPPDPRRGSPASW